MKNYHFFQKYNELVKNVILPLLFLNDVFYSKMAFDKDPRRITTNLRQRGNTISLENSNNNRTEDEMRPININARRIESAKIDQLEGIDQLE